MDATLNGAYKGVNLYHITSIDIICQHENKIVLFVRDRHATSKMVQISINKGDRLKF